MAALDTSPRSEALMKRQRLAQEACGRRSSPKFKDVLRQRCRERVRARRGELMARLRLGQGEASQFLDDEVRDHAHQILSGPIQLEPMDTDWLEPEPSAEDAWLLEEYERLLSAQLEHYGLWLPEQVVCPMCERAVLQCRPEEPGLAACPHCSSRIPLAGDLADLQRRLDAVLALHACPRRPQFTLIEDPACPGLYYQCSACNFFHQLT